MGLPYLEIIRTRELSNMFIPYEIIIDGQSAGFLANGERNTGRVNVGKHCIQVKYLWLRSPELWVDCEAGKHLKIEVGAHNLARYLAPITPAVFLLHLILQAYTGFDKIIILFIPIGILYVFYLTFGYKFYFSIRLLEKEN